MNLVNGSMGLQVNNNKYLGMCVCAYMQLPSLNIFTCYPDNSALGARGYLWFRKGMGDILVILFCKLLSTIVCA